MKKITLSVLMCLSIMASKAQHSSQDLHEVFDIIEIWLEAQKDFEELPGLTAGVVEDQQLLWKASFGQANLQKEVPATPSTLFSICSISKLFTSVAIMQLYDQGKLRLDDPIDSILPWYDLPQKYENSGPITVRSLLTHSSGLPREADFSYWTGPDFPFPKRAEIVEQLSEQETLYPAATYFQYSNLGLTLLGEIVAEVSGMPYEQYIQEHILEPLVLEDTRTELPAALYGDSLAVGYGALTRDGTREKIQLFDAAGIKAAAGFSSNVLDLADFASWQFRLLDSKNAEILEPSTLRNMYNVHWTDPDFSTTWGLGFAVWKGPDGNKWVSHGGSCPGYRTVLQLNPSEKRAYIVMINAGGTNPDLYASRIHALLKKYEAAEEKTPKDSVDLESYAGRYNAQPWGSEILVAPWKGKIALFSLPTENPAEGMSLYQHISEDTFRRIRDNGELGETLVFERDSEGKVRRFRNHQNYVEKMDL